MPVNIHDIPPEILAAAFEFGIYNWGIEFISPLSCVCRNWRFIVENTPRLWGIISVAYRSSPHVLEKQITKAKASPLSIQIFPSAAQGRKHAQVREQLSVLSANWVSADVGTAFLCESGTRWNTLRYNLEALKLSRGKPTFNDPGSFFEDSTYRPQQPLPFHTFSADSLPKAWTIGFLGPWIKHFSLRQWGIGQNLADTWDYLARIPKAVTIELCEVQHVEHPGRIPPIPHTISLPELETLRLKSVKLAPAVVTAIAAPSLRTLSIHHEVSRWWWYGPLTLSGFFTQWSQPSHTPTHLHTLELIDCLKDIDVPYLIRWLWRLPNLVRLLLTDDQIGKVASRSSPLPENEEVNLYHALAYPQKINDNSLWLCPSLMILYLDTTPELMDLIPISCSRGGIANDSAACRPYLWPPCLN